jgi:hypothetical protein
MKTPVTVSSNFSKLIVWTIVSLLGVTALMIFLLAAQPDTTSLGDPYYKDTILAPQRAFGPWALTVFTTTLVLFAAVTEWWQHGLKTLRSRRRSPTA